MEKTIEELQAELKQLKSENLQREIDAERLKIEAAKNEQLNVEKQTMKDEMRLEVLKEMEATSAVSTTKEDMSTSKPEWMIFKDTYCKTHGYAGLTYEDLAKQAYYRSMK